MNKKIIVTAFLLAAGLFATRNAQAQRTYEEMERLTVNEQVTTVITATEPVRFVDISTDKVAGDQPIENIIRLKPKETGHEDGEVLAIVTIVTERYRTQYALIYTTRISEAVADKEIQLQERDAYNNPTVSMSTADMVRFARRVWNSPAKISCPGIGTRQDVQARLPERDCREKDDLSERQAADYRNDGTTNQRAQYQPEHRLRGCAVGRFI